MIFLPYKADLQLPRIPLLTIVVCIICLWIFARQQKNAADYENKFVEFCTQKLDPSLKQTLRDLAGEQHTTACINTFQRIRTAPDPEAVINGLAANARSHKLFPTEEQDRAYIASELRDAYSSFNNYVPKNLTAELSYQPKSYDFKRMISSVFSHADWAHILSNLPFYFVFASCVEIIIGTTLYTGAFLLLTVISCFGYSLSLAASTSSLPTIGLSGVVMGMMGLLATLAPSLRIKCFFWFLIWIRIFSIPVAFIMCWYLALNLINLHNQAFSAINYAAHIAGAFGGIALGVLYRIFAGSHLKLILQNK